MTDDLFSYPHAPGYKEKGGTSQEAASRFVGRAQALRARVLALLKDRRLTADECAELLRESPFAIRPRVSELGRDGLIHKTGERRTNQSGMNAAVWTAN